MKTLYLVDKDPSKIQLLNRTFGEEYQVEGFTSGKACILQIALLEKNHDDLPDVVIIDYSLPDMTGLKLQIKLQKILEDTKLILLVPREKDEVLLKIIRKGFMDYLMKDHNYLSLLSGILERSNNTYL